MVPPRRPARRRARNTGPVEGHGFGQRGPVIHVFGRMLALDADDAAVVWSRRGRQI
jgi:hypothetical protein